MRDPDLFSRLMAFEFDEPGAGMPMRVRLAKENGWGRVYAESVLHEYRKFLYLGAVCPHPVAPSDQVDQAWHLHMLYSKSYWERLCRQVLGFEFHHGPSKGGSEDRARLDSQYSATLAAYRQEFGHEPPADIWPSADRRFESQNRYVRVNLSDHYVISRKALLRVGLVAVGIASVLVAAGCAPLLGAPWFAQGGPAGMVALGIVIIVLVFVVTAAMLKGMKGGGCNSGCSTHGGPTCASDSAGDTSGGDAGCSGGSGCSGGGGG